MRTCSLMIPSTNPHVRVPSYCKSDLVLAGVGRLHEVLGGAHLGGMAGLEATPNDVIGIENVDLKDTLEGTSILS